MSCWLCKVELPKYSNCWRILSTSRVVAVLEGFLIGRAKRAPHWGVQSRFRVIYIYMLSVCRMSVVCQINCVGGIT